MKLLLLPFILFFISDIYCQEEGENKVNFFDREETSIKNPMKLRDPFKAPKIEPPKDKAEGSLLQEGVYTNRTPPSDLTLDTIKVAGVLLGNNRRAIVHGTNKTQTYTLKEGMKISGGNVELKAILPGGVIFVEKITNIYGQTEYLETVIPISN